MSSEFDSKDNLVKLNDDLIKSLKTCHIMKNHVNNNFIKYKKLIKLIKIKNISFFINNCIISIKLINL
jgi:hypothetical protein